MQILCTSYNILKLSNEFKIKHLVFASTSSVYGDTKKFPIDENHGKINFRTASEFSKQLNIHVNHLNKALKETTGKTTSQRNTIGGP